MSIFEGYLFEIERICNSQDKLQKIRNIHWYDSSKNDEIGNDGSIIMIAEPIVNFEGPQDSVLTNCLDNDYYLKYENEQWILFRPSQ
jgi:hypothetical protein